MNPREQQDSDFDKQADAELRALERALGDLDPDELEADIGGDVLTLTTGSGTKIIINRHRAARQIWMAAARQAWHFDRHEESGTWRTAATGEELHATLDRVLSEQLKRPITLRR